MSDAAPLHIPRLRRPILSVGQIWLLLALGCLGIWAGVIAIVRHVMG